MLSKFNILYQDQKLTDVDAAIFEKNHDGGEATLVIKSHSLVLILNSTYFHNSLKESIEERKKVEIYVEKDQGRLFSAIVSSFYDKDFLRTYDMEDLLKILELGDKYANIHFTKFVCQLVDACELDYSRCTKTINTLCVLKCEKSEDVTKELKTNVLDFLQIYFFLENIDRVNFRIFYPWSFPH